MIKKILGLTALGVTILVAPNWQSPYSQFDYFIQLIGWCLMLGPGILLLATFVNHMLNISLDIKPGNKK